MNEISLWWTLEWTVRDDINHETDTDDDGGEDVKQEEELLCCEVLVFPTIICSSMSSHGLDDNTLGRVVLLLLVL